MIFDEISKLDSYAFINENILIILQKSKEYTPDNYPSGKLILTEIMHLSFLQTMIYMNMMVH